jgi:glycosyltransferase involved in cell wall biosynthesis
MSPSRRVAVFRERFLPISETFVRDHLLNLPTWTPVAVTTRRISDGMDVEGVPITDTSRPSGALRVAIGLGRRAGVSEPRLREIALRRALRSTRAEVVHAHFGPDAALVQPAARSAGLPLVATFHGFDATIRPEALAETPAGRRLVEGWDDLVEHAAAIVTVSSFLRAELLARGADPDRLLVIPCGVDTATLPWSRPPPGGGLLFVGRLIDKKGCADMLEALALMADPPPVRIVGDGPLRAELEERAGRLRLRAEFLGAHGSERVREEMERASCVVMPSQRAPNGDCEGLPVVSLEASAMGRPVIGYAHSGMVESIRTGETGILVPERDVRGLAAALEQVVGNGPELERLSRNARRHIEDQFELRDVLRRVESVYEQVT